MNSKNKIKKLDLYNYLPLFLLFIICTAILTIKGLNTDNVIIDYDSENTSEVEILFES